MALLLFSLVPSHVLLLRAHFVLSIDLAPKHADENRRTQTYALCYEKFGRLIGQFLLVIVVVFVWVAKLSFVIREGYFNF